MNRQGQKLHDQEWSIVAKQASVMDGDDAWVSRHPAGGTRLTQEAAPLSIGVELAFIDLHGHQPVQRLLARLPDDSEAAARERAPNPPYQEPLAERGSHADQDSSDSASPALMRPQLADNVRPVGRSVYVASPEGLTGKSAVALGLLGRANP